MPKVSKTQAIRAGKKLGINFDAIDPAIFQYGMNVEMEHGKRRGITNITNDSLLTCAKIALAHLLEFPDYYCELEKMEKKLKKKWKGKRKPHLLN